MAEILQTIDELEILFADLVCSTTGLADDKVLIQNSQQGQPAEAIDADTCYVKVSPDFDDRGLYKNRRMVYNSNKATYTVSQQSYRTLTLQTVFYGPNCYENAYRFNEKLYFQAQQLLLKQNYLALIPDRTAGPTRLNEQRNGLWYQRCDLETRFYNAINIEEVINTFEDIILAMEVDK